MKTHSLLKLKSASLAGLALFSLAHGLHAQTTIAGWTFENLTQATNLNPAPSTNNSAGAVSVASIGMNLYATPNVGVNGSDVTLGATSDTGTNGLADTTQIWRVRGVAGTNGAANGWSSQAPVGTQGAQFFADTTGFNGIHISFDWYSTKQGEANLQLEYTTNGGSTWTNIPVTIPVADSGATFVDNTSGSAANTVVGTYVHGFGGTNGQEWFPNLTATISDPNAANDPGFGIEMVDATTGTADVSMTGGALNNTSGNWRFDNVSISGNAVPEPGTGVALIGGVGMLLGAGRLRRGGRKD